MTMKENFKSYYDQIGLLIRIPEQFGIIYCNFFAELFQNLYFLKKNAEPKFWFQFVTQLGYFDFCPKTNISEGSLAQYKACLSLKISG
jgi:hypothetical protein